MDIRNDYDAISQCNRCGFCQVACPVFRSTGHESGVARGRLALMRAIIEERIDWNRELEEPLFNCLGCGACTSNCFGAVPMVDLITRARAQYLESAGRKPAHRLLFDHLLPYPERLHVAARAVALGKNSGLSKVAGAVGLLRVLGRDLARAEAIVEAFPSRPFRATVKPGEYPGLGASLKTAYFVGCGIDILQHKAGHQTLNFLRRFSRSVTVLDNCCCGLPAWTYGDLSAAGKLAAKNLKILTNRQFDVVVTDCSSCAGFLKRYDRLLGHESSRKSGTKATMPAIQDMVEFMFSQGVDTQADNPPVVATYHDPCHAVRGQGLSGQPREILKKIPGVEFREMPEADWCCGGAGSYALSHYDLSMAVLDRKMANVAATGADLLVTSCPACMIQLSHGVRRAGLKTRVCHISEIAANETVTG